MRRKARAGLVERLKELYTRGGIAEGDIDGWSIIISSNEKEGRKVEIQIIASLPGRKILRETATGKQSEALTTVCKAIAKHM